MDKLSIFISSVAQDSLSSLRDSATRELAANGHHVIRFEDSMQFTHTDSVETCLKYVSKSDILLLFIDTKSGSIIKPENKSVTHLEFTRAYDEGKKILIYVNSSVLNEYFSLLPKLKDIHETYENNFNEFYQALSSFETSVIQDKYVLAFLYDAYTKGYYFTTFNLGVDNIEKIKIHLSSLMKEGLLYLSLKEEIDQAFEHFQTYGSFYENSLKFLEVVQNNEILYPRLLLSRLRAQQTELNVYKNPTIYQKELLFTIKQAKAITLYRKEPEEMVLLEYDGDVTANSIPLTEKNSYVVSTYYDTENEEALYYAEDKQLYYFLFKINHLVFCIHFPTTSEMNLDFALRCHTETLHAIMKSKGYRFCYFLKKLLGG